MMYVAAYSLHSHVCPHILSISLHFTINYILAGILAVQSSNKNERTIYSCNVRRSYNYISNGSIAINECMYKLHELMMIKPGLSLRVS